MTLLLSLLACKTAVTPAETATPPTAPDLAVRLVAGEARAGQVTDAEAFFGGVSAEGRIGDFKIYNDRVQFIVQGSREGSYYVQVGGGVIDADIVRPEGVLGRDLVDEWSSMLGFGRLLRPDTVEVVSDGTEGSDAVIRVTGTDVPLAIALGALEAPSLFPDLGLTATTEYRLAPDSWLMEVTTTVTATTPVNAFAIGDILMGSPELGDSWSSRSGLEDASGERAVSGYLGVMNDGAVAIMSLPGNTSEGNAGADLIASLTDLVLGFDDTLDLDAGQAHSFTRYYGAAPDLATLTDAAYGEGQSRTSGTITAPDGPVEGARVHVLVDDEPYTVAITGPDGTYDVAVPPGAVTTQVDGRSRSMFTDLPHGYAAWPAFAEPPVYTRAIASYTDGDTTPRFAQGRGLSTDDTLGQPGFVRIESADGLPFTARLGSSSPDPTRDARTARSRPNGLMAAGWSRGGTLEMAVEPGTFDLLVHRGMRYELHTEEVTVTAGETVTITADLAAAYTHPGYLLGDPHSHASPSGDGQISMEERLLVQAAGGIQLHFGTDHDRVADYRPLVDALDLQGFMRSIVADEVSSVLRGHMNTYPLEPDPSMPNHGAVSWWGDIPETTDAIVQAIRERHGDVIVSANHPLDSGLAESADWSPGVIGDASFWSEDLDAIEVLNDGQYSDYSAVYLDLLNRGYVLTPVGVSDSHGHFQATPGMNGTYIGIGSELDDYSDSALLEVYDRGQTIASLGVFLEMSIPPGAELTAPDTLTVTAHTPSWIQVDRLKLLVNGLESEVVEGTTATFEIDALADASFVVVAEGDSLMQPVTNERPWAMSSAIRLDVDNDGWMPPLPPLALD